MEKIFIFLIILNLANIGFSKLEEDTTELILEAQGISQSEVGFQGTIGLLTNLSSTHEGIDDDIESIIFTGKIILENSEDSYSANCNLWRPKTENLTIICTLLEQINQVGEISFKLNDTTLNYKDNKHIKIYTKEFIKITVSKVLIPFLYSEDIAINFTQFHNYEIKLKIAQYYDNPLVIISHYSNLAIILECIKDGKELLCKLQREKMQGLLVAGDESFTINFIYGNIGHAYCGKVGEILIHYLPPKEDIFVGIENLLTKNINNHNYIALETNITKIYQVSTGNFKLGFNYGNNKIFKDCFMKKYDDDKPLMILCETSETNQVVITLAEITGAFKENDISSRFAPIIQPAKIEEAISIDNNGNKFKLITPHTLDYSQKDTYNLTLIGEFDYWDNQNNLSLYPVEKNLECERNNKIIECEIPKKYFDGKESGTYYLYQENYLGEKNRVYELPPLKVYISDGKNSGKINHINTIMALFLVCILL